MVAASSRARIRVRVVNVVDLMTLFPQEVHPHGMSESKFLELFTADKPIIFAFHGYQRALHAIVHGRSRADRFHVRGFNEQGTTTTPFQMVVLNDISRYHIAMAALRASKSAGHRNGSISRTMSGRDRNGDDVRAQAFRRSARDS